MWVLFSTILLYQHQIYHTLSYLSTYISGNFFIYFLFFCVLWRSKRDTRDLYFLVCSKLIVFLIFQSVWDGNKNNPSQSNFYTTESEYTKCKSYVVSSTINIYLQNLYSIQKFYIIIHQLNGNWKLESLESFHFVQKQILTQRCVTDFINILQINNYFFLRKVKFNFLMS